MKAVEALSVLFCKVILHDIKMQRQEFSVAVFCIAIAHKAW